jgi:iron complex transport system substrate-binding protein
MRSENQFGEVGQASVLTRIEDVTRREFVFGALGAALLVACRDDSDSAEPAVAPTTRRVTHQMGETEMPLEPQRIVSLWRPTLAALVLLGFKPVGSVGDAEAVGFGLASYVPDDYSLDDLTIVGPNREYDLERMAGLRPDLIIGALTSSGPEKDLYPALSQIAPTVMVSWTGTESWRGQLIEVAEALGMSQKADAVVADYQSRVEVVRKTAGSVTDVRVSLVRVQGPGQLRLETPRSFPGQVIQDIGLGRPDGQLMPDPDRDYIEISLERIREADGDMVFVFVNASNAAAWDEIRKNSLWQGLSAVQAGKVFVFDYEWWGASNYYGAYRILSDVQEALASA